MTLTDRPLTVGLTFNEAAAPPGTFTHLFDGNGLTPFAGSGNALFPSAQTLESLHSLDPPQLPNFHGDPKPTFDLDIVGQPVGRFEPNFDTSRDFERTLEDEIGDLRSEMATIYAESGTSSYCSVEDLEFLLEQLDRMADAGHSGEAIYEYFDEQTNRA